MSEEPTVVETALYISNDQKLKSSSQQLVDKITESSDVDEIKKITQLFNINQTKKELARVNKLNDILDTINDKILDRLNTEDLRDEDLIKYNNSINQALTRSLNTANTVQDKPLINLYQENNTINIQNNEPLSRESRERVLDAVKFLLSTNQTETFLQEVPERRTEPDADDV